MDPSARLWTPEGSHRHTFISASPAASTGPGREWGLCKHWPEGRGGCAELDVRGSDNNKKK